MFPKLVERVLRASAFSKDDLLDGVNREVVQVLRDTRQRLNELIMLLGNAGEPYLVTSNITLDEDDGTVFVTLPGLTVTLPPATDYATLGGQRITFRNRYSAGVGDTTILPSGSDTIEGGASYTLVGDGAFVTLVAAPTSVDLPADNWNEIG